MKTRSLTLLMTIIFCLSLFTGMAVSADFQDASEDHRHYEAITYLKEKGVIEGYEDGTFRPENTVTRAEFVKMLLGAIGISNVYGDAIVTTNFTDVDAAAGKVQHWAAGYIKLAVDKGVVNGYGDGTFRPDAPVTYEEAIKMTVCCLGREEHAKTRAENLKINLWPDAYLSIGNDLMIAKSTDYDLGEHASRSNIAQMLYNVKDVQIIIAPNINIGGMTGGSTGGGVGTGGSGTVTDSTTVVSGLITYGQVVAGVKQTGDTRKPLIIDDNIVIDGSPVTSVANNYIIVKLEAPIDGNDYQKFHTGGTDYSGYLGYRIELRYRYNPDGDVSGRYEIEAIFSKDTEALSIDSTKFRREKTDQKNLTETNIHICYTSGEYDYYQSLFTDDLDTLKVIYNNKVIDVEALKDQYLMDNPSYAGTRDAIDIITLADLMPQSGNIRIINAYEDNTIDLVWVNSYETYVVGTRNFNTTPKSITDKFRTSGLSALSLVLDDTNPSINLEITNNGREMAVTGIPVNAILTVAKSKCGTNIEVSAERSSGMTSVLKTIKRENGVIKEFTMANNATYKLNDYFLNYVEPGLEYENGDTMTIYVNSNNEIVWATIAEVSYTTGYLFHATIDDGTGKLNLDILGPDGTVKRYTMSDTRTRYITKATTCLGGITPDNVSNPNGNMYKNLDEMYIYQSLQENATTINTGKPAYLTTNASCAQPIMYSVASGTELFTLVTFEPDTENKFTGTSLKYEKLNGEHNFSNVEDSFSAASSATFIFVPNDRRAYPTGNGYKIGTVSSSVISQKLVEYMQYNIEPFYTTDSSGNRKRTAFVVYNQNIDAVPNYRSENIIVRSIEETLTGSTTTYTLKGTVTGSNSIKSYTTYSRDILFGETATVLDENFQRTATKRAIEVGDVVRVGYSPTGTIVDVEIILDISEAHKATQAKSTAVSVQSEILSVDNPNKLLVNYYVRVGEVTEIDSATVPEWCKIRINGGTESRIQIGTGFSNKPILLYDYNESNPDNRLKSVTMSDLWGGEMLFVHQGANLEFKQIYAVRYPAANP